MNFNKVIEKLDALGVEYHREYEYRGAVGPDRKMYHLDTFKSVRLPFTSDQWCRLCMREGDLYIGGCCGNTSNLQDYLNGWFRDGGWADVREIASFNSAIFNHEGFENWNDNVSITKLYNELSVDWVNADPLNKLALVWKLTKNYYNPEPLTIVHDKYKDDPYTHMGNLARALQNMSWHRAFKSDDEDTTQIKSSIAMSLHRILPPLKKLNDTILSINPGIISGYAIVDANNLEKVAQNGNGYCVFDKYEEVKNMFLLWDRADEEYKEAYGKKGPAQDRYKVRKVNISTDKGMEFGEIIEV